MLVYIILISLIIKGNTLDIHKEELILGDETYNSYKFNILHHLSGISPYFESNVDELNPSPEEGCEVDKTVYLIRHGSVYVDDYDYFKIIKPFLERLNKSLININGSSKLSFLSQWKSPILNNKQIEKLTKSGYLEAFKLGVELSYRYPKLLPKQNDSSFKIWASDSDRTKQSASAIFEGLFGGNKADGKVVDIPETKNLGANSLTPTKTCQKFKSSKGANEANIWLNVYTKPILERFYLTNLNSNDILAMQQLCGYETVIRGESSFCHLFTSEEWISYEYYFDIKYYYELGYGNHLSGYIGMPFVKAINQLFNQTNNQKIFINVAHREIIPIVLVSLGLFKHSDDIILSFNQINHYRTWKSSRMIPFLGRIAFERFNCLSSSYNGSFVRIILNSSPQPLKGCSSGPGDSCPLQQFHNYINQRSKFYKHFSKVCQNEKYIIDDFTLFNN